MPHSSPARLWLFLGNTFMCSSHSPHRNGRPITTPFGKRRWLLYGWTFQCLFCCIQVPTVQNEGTRNDSANPGQVWGTAAGEWLTVRHEERRAFLSLRLHFAGLSRLLWKAPGLQPVLHCIHCSHGRNGGRISLPRVSCSRQICSAKDTKLCLGWRNVGQDHQGRKCGLTRI